MENEEVLTAERMSFGMLFGYAWSLLKAHTGILIGAIVLTAVINLGVQFFPIACLFSWFLLFPMKVGLVLMYLSIVRQKQPDIQMLFQPYSDYGRLLWGAIRQLIFVFLWSLLLIIPGIIATIRYSMTYYLLLDHPEYTVKQAMTESCEITYGYKWRLFGYGLLLWLICQLLLLIILIPIILLLVGGIGITGYLAHTGIWGAGAAGLTFIVVLVMLFILCIFILASFQEMMGGLIGAGIYECIRKKPENPPAEIPEQLSIDADCAQ